MPAPDSISPDNHSRPIGRPFMVIDRDETLLKGQP